VVAGIVSGVVVLAAVIAIVLAASTGSSDPRPDDTDFAQDPATAAQDVVPSPQQVEGQRQDDGSVVFTWVNPDPEPDDTYLWGILTVTGEPELQIVPEPTVTVPVEQAGDEVCITVSIVRADRRSSAEPAEVCA
jgi:eukaryotic-like serine/threonine-protein kinase